MEGEALREGKARVRAWLVEPLEARGMVRRARVTLAEHEGALDRLAARLAYMTEDGLAALAEVVERHAEGKARNVWPAEVSICNWARRIEPPPASESRLVRSMLQSAAGRAAAEGGYAVELFLYLKKFGQPPIGDYGWHTIRREAEENARRRRRIAELAEDGAVAPSDRDWLDGYLATRARVLDIVQAGERTA
ncbi:hypothetical protein SAMN05444722_1700 [Rhodovulum sp. ES.010]|uniref:hypothetical protein n=1 Tax=Rhodovulum sp. ES.010 TaxID=1882821 RepID=UPI00092A1146|nr:hypothetical protein [Rhodovulum sp. ES.010]SIO36693.1 hypothetical protein SAMN05444722_1700 [Rhodovulum sp. ES.010]